MDILQKTAIAGYCSSCERKHFLYAESSQRHCLKLMYWLQKENRIDRLSTTLSNPRYSTENLFGEARGKMFGILEGRDAEGRSILLYGFSGQYNGLWNVPGWVPPIFNEEEWQIINTEYEPQIKRITAEMNHLDTNEPQYRLLKKERKARSQDLMKKLHALYRIRNFRGESSTLAPFFSSSRGIPTGAGDCCAPKLLSFAQKTGITPLSISEFFWGKSNKSKSCFHGKFYPACEEKCAPLLGFMLCGLTETP